MSDTCVPQSPHSPLPSWVGLILPAGLLSAGAFVLGADLARSEGGPRALSGHRGLEATPLLTDDLDGDGLVDQIENIEGTDPFAWDTDGDGYGDLEEFARQSDPSLLQSVPGPEPISLAMTARVVAGLCDIQIPIYLQNSTWNAVDFELGFMFGGVISELPSSFYLPITAVSVLPALDPQDSIVLLNMLLPESVVNSLGAVSFYATAAPAGQSPTTSAAVNLMSTAGVITAIMPQGGQGSGGSLYRPIQEPGMIPATWAPGEICTQTTSVVGISGARVVQKVETAECKDADGHCMPTCSSKVGEQIEVLDPVALIGG